MKDFRTISHSCIGLFFGILFLIGLNDPVVAQPGDQSISSVAVSPVYIQSSSESVKDLSKINTPRYALLSADQIKYAAYLLNEKSDKLAHEVMWFYSQEDLKNIAGLESVGDLSAKLNNMILQEPKTSATQRIERENATSVR